MGAGSYGLRILHFYDSEFFLSLYEVFSVWFTRKSGPVTCSNIGPKGDSKECQLRNRLHDRCLLVEGVLSRIPTE